jgi:hypothetical protein
MNGSDAYWSRPLWLTRRTRSRSLPSALVAPLRSPTARSLAQRTPQPGNVQGVSRLVQVPVCILELVLGSPEPFSGLFGEMLRSLPKIVARVLPFPHEGDMCIADAGTLPTPPAAPPRHGIGTHACAHVVEAPLLTTDHVEGKEPTVLSSGGWSLGWPDRFSTVLGHDAVSLGP